MSPAQVRSMPTLCPIKLARYRKNSQMDMARLGRGRGKPAELLLLPLSLRQRIDETTLTWHAPVHSLSSHAKHDEFPPQPSDTCPLRDNTIAEHDHGGRSEPLRSPQDDAAPNTLGHRGRNGGNNDGQARRATDCCYQQLVHGIHSNGPWWSGELDGADFGAMAPETEAPGKPKHHLYEWSRPLVSSRSSSRVSRVEEVNAPTPEGLQIREELIRTNLLTADGSK